MDAEWTWGKKKADIQKADGGPCVIHLSKTPDFVCMCCIECNLYGIVYIDANSQHGHRLDGQYMDGNSVDGRYADGYRVDGPGGRRRRTSRRQTAGPV